MLLKIYKKLPFNTNFIIINTKYIVRIDFDSSTRSVRSSDNNIYIILSGIANDCSTISINEADHPKLYDIFFNYLSLDQDILPDLEEYIKTNLSS